MKMTSTSVALVATLALSTSAHAQEEDASEATAQATTPSEEPEAPPEPEPESTQDADADAESAEVENQVNQELPPVPSGSGGIALFPVDATNLDDGEGQALAVLMTAHIQEQQGGRVIGGKKSGPFLNALGDPVPAAEKLGVEQFISVQAVRLSKTTVITATLYDSSGKSLHSSKMSARSVDDFEFVSERLVRALLQRKSAKETRRLNNITNNEGRENNRLFVEKVFGPRVGFTIPVASGVSLSPMVSASFDARLEGESYFIEFGAGLLLPSNSGSYEQEGVSYGGVRGEIGGSYYLTDNFVSPYVGGGVMPRMLSSSIANMAVYGQAGLMFFRQSSSRLYAELRVAQNITKMDVTEYSETLTEDGYYDYESDTRTILPTEFEINVGVGW